jgi:urease gamma subunit
MQAETALYLAGFHLTQHARERAAQRGIRLEAAEIVLRFGRWILGERGYHYSLEGVRRTRTVAPDLWNEARRVVVVVDAYDNIPTIYSDERG